MLLAHKLAGFTLEEADKLRKLLVKPTTTDAERIKKERKEIGDKFIISCVKSGLTQKRAEQLWEKEILGFISYGFNKAHAQSYAYNSYHCAWLYTYYEKEWMKACLECDPELEKTVNVTRSLGYPVMKVDINTSPVESWDLINGSWAPPLTSLRGMGSIASNELLLHRPKDGFKDISNFFFNELGEWRWSKLNKKSIEALIKAESFNSLGCVGSMDLFKNYKHMYEFISGNWDELKKGKIKLDDAIISVCDDWSVAEKIVIQREIIGFYDKGLIVGKFLKMFEEFEVSAIDEYGETDGDEEYAGDMIRVWGIVEKVIEKTTITKKPFLVVTVSGVSNKPYSFRVWNASVKNNTLWKEGNVIICSLDYDEDYGYSLSNKSKVMKVTK